MPRVDPIPELKRAAAAELVRLIDGWNAYDIASLIGTDQPRISDLRRGKLDRFSLEKLIRMLARQHCAVQLRFEVNPKPFARSDERGGRGGVQA